MSERLRCARLPGWSRAVAAVVAVVVVFAYPSFAANNYQLTVGSDVMLAVTLAVSFWPLLVAGQLNMAHVALMAIAAYVTGALAVELDYSWWAAVPAAVLAAVAVSFVLGVVTLRLKGAYFFLVTFAFLVAVQLFFAGYLVGVFGGPSGLVGVPRLPDVSLAGVTLELGGLRGTYYVGAALAVVSVALVRRLMVSNTGTLLRAVGETDSLAESVGVDAFRLRLMTLVLSGAIAGLAGSYFAYRTGVVHGGDFGLGRAVLVVVYVVVGGVSSIWGPIIGAVLITVLGEWLRELETLRQLGYGLLLVVTMMFLPNGITSLAARARAVARRACGRPAEARSPAHDEAAATATAVRDASAVPGRDPTRGVR